MKEEQKDNNLLFLRFIETGNEKYFEQFYKQCYPWLFKMVNKMMFNRNMASDIVQNVFMKLLINKDKFNIEKGNINSWLWRIARNEVLVYYRRKKQDSGTFIDNQNPDDFKSDFMNAEKRLAWLERNETVQKAIDKLPEKYQQIIYMFYYMEFDLSEICEKLQLPEGTVKSHLFRARQKLGSLLGKKYHEHLLMELLIFIILINNMKELL